MPPPEARARKQIDAKLEAAGWILQDKEDFDRHAGLGVAVREFELPSGPADYLLFIEGKACGVVEAKPGGTTLSGIADQSETYASLLPDWLEKWASTLRFAYESTGVETYFRDRDDPKPRSRDVYTFHRPRQLHAWMQAPDTLRTRLQRLPPLDAAGLRACQTDAIQGLEKSLAGDHPRALIQMATGAGKTFTACSSVYRLVKFGGAHRILFLVDRTNLGEQTLREFQSYRPPDDPRPFTALYNVQLLKSNRIDADAKVVITTIQRLFSILRGEAEFDETAEEVSGFETPAEGPPKEIAYNPGLPIEEFDFVIIDECHRSIYNLWRQTLEYFDAYLIGLTATPSALTLGFFRNNLVCEYPYERSVVEGVNVGYEIYRIKTDVSTRGGTVAAGYQVGVRDRRTRRLRWETLDADLIYLAKEVDRSVTVPDQIRTVLKTYREKLFADLFPGRTWVPKTLIFAKDDNHAEEIVKIAREVFEEGNDFAKKITYRTTGDDPKTLLQRFRIEPMPRIVVTVDMIATGTDVRPIEVVMFMRDVKSALYYEQMKGRGARTLTPDELRTVTPDANAKTRFVLVDAVGVTESTKSDTQPLERKRGIAFPKLLEQVAGGRADDDTLSSLAARLAALDREVGVDDRSAITAMTKGKNLADLSRALYDAIDTDRVQEEAVARFGVGAASDPKALADAQKQMKAEAIRPFENPALRRTLVDVKTRTELYIDEATQDVATYAGYDVERANAMIARFKEFLEAYRDRLVALEIIYSRRYAERRLTYQAIRDLVEALERPPIHLTTAALWEAYARLEVDKVRRVTDPGRLLTNIVALVRYAIGQDKTLEPFDAGVTQRFNLWLGRQKRAGKAFSDEQILWLMAIRDHIAANIEATRKDLLEHPAFADKGGLVKFRALFGERFAEVLDELNGALVA